MERVITEFRSTAHTLTINTAIDVRPGTETAPKVGYSNIQLMGGPAPFSKASIILSDSECRALASLIAAGKYQLSVRLIAEEL